MSIDKCCGILASDYELNKMMYGIFFFLDTGSPYVAQAGLELLILLSQLPKCWDYRCVPAYLVNVYNLNYL
jgi:hypothetical protein